MSPGTAKVPSQVTLGEQDQNEIIIYEEEAWTITLSCPRKKTLGVEGKWGNPEQWFSMVFFAGPPGSFKKGFMEVSSLTSAAMNTTSTSVSFRYWSSTKHVMWGKKGFTVKNIIETISPDLLHRKETPKKMSGTGNAVSWERGMSHEKEAWVHGMNPMLIGTHLSGDHFRVSPSGHSLTYCL